METAVEQKIWTYGAALPLLFAAVSTASIVRFIYFTVVALLKVPKSGGHSHVKIEGEENREERSRCLSTPVVVNTLDELEECLLVEILSRLPVRTLFQLKSVCRRWKDIISSPYLVSMHLKNYTNGPAGNASQTLMVHDSGRHLVPKIFQLDPDGDVSQIRSVDNRMQIIHGPCNGIYLLSDRLLDGNVCLWNPAIGSSRRIPLPAIGDEITAADYGFGLHSTVDDDFKIVLIRHCCPEDNEWPYYPRVPPITGHWSCPEFPSQVMVYTVGTNTWREVEELRHPLEIVQFTEDYRYLNGFCFWLCASPVAALAFDLRNDVFRVIDDPIPVAFDGQFDKRSKRLFLYKDSLALCILQEGGRSDGGGYDMWLLSEQWCWIKHFTIGPFIPKDLMAVGCWRNNQIIVRNRDGTELLTNSHLLLFDPATRATKVLVPNCRFPSGVYYYVESLVNVSGNEVG